MTVETTINRVNYSTNGISTDFATTYPFLLETDLIVWFIDSAGNTFLQALTTDYTVSGGNGSTGTVSFLVAPATGGQVLIIRTEPLTQESDYVNNDKTDADVQERVADKAVMIDQQLSTRIDRSVQLDETMIASFDTILPADISDAAGQAIVVNDTGDGLVMGFAATVPPSTGRFLRRTVLTKTALDANSNEFTTGANTGQLFIELIGGGGAGETLKALVQVQNAGTTYVNWFVGDSSGTDTSVQFSDSVITLTAVGSTGSADTRESATPVTDAFGNASGVVTTPGAAAAEGLIIVDEYTGSTFTTPS